MSLVNLISKVLTPDYSVVYLVNTVVMEEAPRRPGAGFEGILGSIPVTDDDYDDHGFEGEFKIEDGRTFLRLAGQYPQPTLDLPANNADHAGLMEVHMGDPSSHGSQIRNTSLKQGVFIPSCSRLWRISRVNQVVNHIIIGYGSVFTGLIAIAIIGGISHFKEGHSTHAQRVWTMMWLAFGIAVGPSLASESSLRGLYAEESAQLGYRLGIVCFLYRVPAIGGFVVVAQMLNAYGRCIRIY